MKGLFSTGAILLICGIVSIIIGVTGEDELFWLISGIIEAVAGVGVLIAALVKKNKA